MVEVTEIGESAYMAVCTESPIDYMCYTDSVHPDLDDKNYWVDISVLENVERLGTLRKGTAPEYALNRLLEYQKAVRASSPQDAGYCTFYHVLKTKCNAHSHEQLHQVNMTAKQRQHILLAAGITHVQQFDVHPQSACKI